MPIDLAAPRVLAFEVGKSKYTMTVKPITKAMWLAYFGAIISTDQRLEDGTIESTSDATGARLELLESALIGATGYTPTGSDAIDTIPGWQAKLPMSHRLAAANMLTAVRLVPPDADSFELGFETVTLAATWTAGENGRMQEITGLRHTFRSPSAEQQARYSRANSRSVIEGNSRTGVTRYLGAQDVLIELYDELIERYEGYVGNVEAIDAFHKVAAVSTLFTPAVIA